MHHRARTCQHHRAHTCQHHLAPTTVDGLTEGTGTVGHLVEENARSTPAFRQTRTCRGGGGGAFPLDGDVIVFFQASL
jgi:hypothetical protein